MNHRVKIKGIRDLLLINKKRKRSCHLIDFAVPADHKGKIKESEKRDKYLDLARELKKLWNMKVTVMLVVSGTVSKRLKKETGSQSKNRDHSIDKKCPGDLRRLATTKTPVKYYQLTLILFAKQALADSISLFNGISTFVGYLMPKLFS